MPQITSVESQKRNPKRFNIFIDGKFAFGADEDLVVKYRLISGKDIQPPRLEELLFEAEVGKLMEKMYNLFSIRQRSEKEIRDYFKIKNLKLKIQNSEGISDLVIEMLVDRLKEKGMIDDCHFAKAWVESRRRSKQKGINALKMELLKKGIDREIIEDVLKWKVGSESEEELAKKVLEKKMRIWKNLPKEEFKKKAYEFLLRRGFEYSIIKEIINDYSY